MCGRSCMSSSASLNLVDSKIFWIVRENIAIIKRTALETSKSRKEEEERTSGSDLKDKKYLDIYSMLHLRLL